MASDPNSPHESAAAFLTIRRIAEKSGRPLPATIPADSQLGSWLARTADIPLHEISLDDISIAIRQQAYLDEVLPEALSRLDREPLAGWKYDGELAFAVAQIPRAFWIRHPTLLKLSAQLFRKALATSEESGWILSNEIIVAMREFEDQLAGVGTLVDEELPA